LPADLIDPLKHRVLEPELLDSLPHDHPDALASRDDIHFLNGIMGNFRWIKLRLKEQVRPEDRIVELGAGDGGLTRYVTETDPDFAKQWTGLDFAPRPRALPLGVGWVQGDFFQDQAAQSALENGTVIVANLILHHFTDEQLRRLAASWKNAQVLVVSEPARYRRHHWKGRLLNAILGFNHVTLYDMGISIRAGFRVGELPSLMGLEAKNWDWKEQHSSLGANQLVAWRRK
jgi:SAM-dependent methyltransferase